MTTQRVDFIFQIDGKAVPVGLGGNIRTLPLVMHGTPYMIKGWLEFLPEQLSRFLVKDTAVDLLVTARQYIEKLKTGNEYGTS
jgi:hypothetical protein